MPRPSTDVLDDVPCETPRHEVLSHTPRDTSTLTNVNKGACQPRPQRRDFFLPDSSRPSLDKVLQAWAGELRMCLAMFLSSQNMLASELSSKRDHLIRLLEDLSPSESDTKFSFSDVLSAEQLEASSGSPKARLKTEAARSVLLESLMKEDQVIFPIKSRMAADGYEADASGHVQDGGAAGCSAPFATPTLSISPNFETALCSLRDVYEHEVGELRSQIQALQEQLANRATTEGAPPPPLVLSLLSVPKTHGPAVEEGPDQNARDSDSSFKGHAIHASESEELNKVVSDRPTRASSLFPALVLQRERNAESFPQLSYKPSTFSWTALVESSSFETLSMSMIFLNTIAMMVQVQYEGYDVAHSLDVAGYNTSKEEAWPKADVILGILERAFIIFFTVELTLRIAAYRCKFFNRYFHWLDSIIVAAGLIDWIADELFDPKMLRLLRFIKLGRIVRTFNNPRLVDALFFLTASIRASLSILMWSLAVLTVIQSIAALTIFQLLSHWFDDAPQSPASVEVFLYYGTFTRSILTMFEILLANWIVPCRVLSDHVGEYAGLLVLTYRVVCGFAVLNVISAVFINQTMKIMSQDTAIMLMERGRAEEKYKSNLQKLFALLDVSQDGVLTKDEMFHTLENPDVHLECFKMGIGIHDLEDIIDLCDVHDGGMTINEFIQTAHNVRKQANTLEVARVLVHSKRISEQVDRMEKRLDAVLSIHSPVPCRKQG